MDVRSLRGAAAALFFAAAIGLVRADQAAALPDLVPSVYDVQVRVADVPQADVDEGCAGGRYNRRLIKFSLRTDNIGASDLILGATGCPNCSLNPGATCTNPLFVCGTSHGHAHFESFAQNQVLDSEGNVVAEGRKYGFCLLDLQCPNPHYSCSYQGITAGCHDVYTAGLPCQYVDITDENLPDGVYTLRVNIDPENILAESNDSNNIVEFPFSVGETEQVCPLYSSTDVPKALPDLASTTSVVTIPDLGPVTSVRVRAAGAHPFFGDLEGRLTSPAATTRKLFSGMCGSNDNFDFYLGDDAVDPFVCPATESEVVRTPMESFTPFHGQQAAGNWTLTIQDLDSNDSGILTSWGLEVCSVCGNGELDPGETCDDGNASNGDCCSANCQVAAVNGTPCEDGNQCTISETCAAGACVPGGDATCDPCLVCDPDDGCVVPDLVYPCQEPPTRGSVLKIRRNPFYPEKNTLIWRWRSQTPVELDELGAPELVTDVSVCVYDGGELFLSATIPAGETCDDGDPCWKRRAHDAMFSDREGQFGGMSLIRMKEGDTGRIFLKARGDSLLLPNLNLSMPTTVRLRRGDGTPCWEANYDSASTADLTTFKARSR